MTAASGLFARAADVAKPLRSECAAYLCGSSPLRAPIFFTRSSTMRAVRRPRLTRPARSTARNSGLSADAARRKPGLAGRERGTCAGGSRRARRLPRARPLGWSSSVVGANTRPSSSKRTSSTSSPTSSPRRSAPANPTWTSARSHVDPPFAAGRDRDAQLVDQQGGFRPRRDPALTADAREGGADCARSSSAAQAGVSTEAPVAFVAIIARCGRRAPATRSASHEPSQGDGAAVRIDADVLQVRLGPVRRKRQTSFGRLGASSATSNSAKRSQPRSRAKAMAAASPRPWSCGHVSRTRPLPLSRAATNG